MASGRGGSAEFAEVRLPTFTASRQLAQRSRQAGSLPSVYGKPAACPRFTASRQLAPVQGAAFMQSSPRPSSLAPRHSSGKAARLAFTLLELLIAISIIAILASLILTVASSAMHPGPQRPGRRRHSKPVGGNRRVQAAFRRRAAQQHLPLRAGQRLDHRPAFDGPHPPNLAAIRLHLRGLRQPRERGRHQRQRHNERRHLAQRRRVPGLFPGRHSCQLNPTLAAAPRRASRRTPSTHLTSTDQRQQGRSLGPPAKVHRFRRQPAVSLSAREYGDHRHSVPQHEHLHGYAVRCKRNRISISAAMAGRGTTRTSSWDRAPVSVPRRAQHSDGQCVCRCVSARVAGLLVVHVSNVRSEHKHALSALERQLVSDHLSRRRPRNTAPAASMRQPPRIRS